MGVFSTSSGETVTLPAPAGAAIVEGSCVRIGNGLCGVALHAAAAAADLTMVVSGRVEGVAKTSGTTISVGDTLYQRVATHAVYPSSATGDRGVGVAMTTAGTSDLSVSMLIWPQFAGE